ncbi:rifin PIR protein, putative [Plasmodium reichenowi]|uniref:Rifin PIR protein, putative n=1 Tax=Plasmodium reichenowi TaxID=5854 RepID=A0A2P9D3X3_PLARE|nr:rifin PIR protein, putative [Plasmodium reichenowi]
MKLHYSKILLFSLPLNILLTSYQAHNKNKPCITPHHTPRYPSRVLSEKDIQSSNYDKNADIKSVKENFDLQTSQRFEEYEERMIEKRQKRKEERDKNIQKIIEKDKMEKSLAEKVEKGCFRCGCALGGGVLPVWGLVSGLWYATLSQYVSTTFGKMATDAGIKAGVEVGLVKVTEILKDSLNFATSQIPPMNVLEMLTKGISAEDVTLYGIFKCMNNNINGLVKAHTNELFSTTVKTMVEKTFSGFNKDHFVKASEVTKAVAKAKEGVLAEGASKTSSLTTGITASVVAIVVIVLVMVIIYLVLRYRRKKKMKKKAQYTKLLNQ